jgi:hypothetical protein
MSGVLAVADDLFVSIECTSESLCCDAFRKSEVLARETMQYVKEDHDARSESTNTTVEGIRRDDVCKQIAFEVCGLELLQEERTLVLIQPHPALVNIFQGILHIVAASRLCFNNL